MKISHLKEEAIRLRREGRKSFSEISSLLPSPVAKSTLSLWLRPYPLTSIEVKDKNYKGRRSSGPRSLLSKREEPSKLYVMAQNQNWSSLQKAKVAEAAILLRLVLHGLNPYTSVFDGDKIDWIVEHPSSGRLLKLQVKWARRYVGGADISVRCSNGTRKRRKYEDKEFDYIIAYDLFSDTAFVYSKADVGHVRHAIALRDDAAERWDKILNMVA
jgi:hypothetical protein